MAVTDVLFPGESLECYFPSVLTERQLQMLQMVANDECYDSIGAKLGMPEQCVKNQMHFTIRELNCSSRTGAVATALRQGLID